MLVGGEPAGRLGVDELPEAVEEGRFAGGDADGCQLCFEAEPGEDRGRVRQDVDADADGSYLRRSLVDLTVATRVVQFESQGQPPDPGSDNGELHVATMPARKRTRERAAANSAVRDDKVSPAETSRVTVPSCRTQRVTRSPRSTMRCGCCFC